MCHSISIGSWQYSLYTDYEQQEKLHHVYDLIHLVNKFFYQNIFSNATPVCM